MCVFMELYVKSVHLCVYVCVGKNVCIHMNVCICMCVQMYVLTHLYSRWCGGQDKVAKTQRIHDVCECTCMCVCVYVQ